ncbi:VanZ family protein [Enterocloster clostridioformis]|jgi:glycopeptide antibiotics resistance protein|uniref:VanZ family protein n=1 Tax=Enterocloster clostridioformis TaxID=1531 RepID=UPI000481341D|nr:VanZ family protein [Enterocloster clostridioformis]
MKRRSTYLAVILFLIYLALLVWIILFKLQFSISDLDKIRSVNIIPFHYDKKIGAAFHLTEVLENVLIFMPMGIYLQMLLSKAKFYAKIMVIAGTSLLLETTQYVLAIGRSDITDILTNTAGGLLGLVVYSMIVRLLGDRAKTNRLFSVLAVIVSAIVIGLLGFILFANR